MTKKSKQGVYNPLIKDFTVGYDLSGKAKRYKVPAREIAYFDEPVAKHVKKHLATAILNERGVTGGDGIKRPPEVVLKEIEKEISI